MNLRQLLLGSFALTAASGALAADDRLKSVLYDPEKVVRIQGRPGIQSSIEFGPDERIENVAVGDSTAWQVTPNRRGSIVFLKPLSSTSRTNMTVVTDRRTYLFDLVAVGKDSTPLYSLTFSYPATETATVDAAATAEEARAEKVPAVDVSIATPDRLNFDWKVKASKGLRLSRIFDDGYSLYLAWDARSPLPAVLTVSERGEEAPLNYRISGEYIVVSPVPSLVVLRYGRKSAELRRMHPLPARPNPTSPIQQHRHGDVALAQSSSPAVPLQSLTTVGVPAAIATRVEPPSAAELLRENLTGGQR